MTIVSEQTKKIGADEIRDYSPRLLDNGILAQEVKSYVCWILMASYPSDCSANGVRWEQMIRFESEGDLGGCIRWRSADGRWMISPGEIRP